MLILVLASLVATAAAQPLLPITVKAGYLSVCCHGLMPCQPGTGKFFDSAGRQRIFHGLNVVVKQPPYLPVTV